MTTRTQTDALPRTFWWHNYTQSLGALNDNLFKLFMIYALISWHGPEAGPNILAKVGFVFALPFLLIVPIAGSFADKFSKQRIILHLKSTEFCVMALGVLALTWESSGLLYLTMFLMSAQSACFGPCKYGIIPEQVSTGQLSRANGLLQLFTFLAIILGTVLAPELSLLFNGHYHVAASALLYINTNLFDWNAPHGFVMLAVILIHSEDNPKKLIQSLKTARAALDKGYLVCIFAEGALSPDGKLHAFKPGFERIVKGTDYPIIPVHIHGAWESVGSHRQGEPVINPLRDIGTRIQLIYGPPLAATSTSAKVEQAVRQLGEAASSFMMPSQPAIQKLTDV